MNTTQKCEDRIDAELRDRINDLRRLWSAYVKGESDAELGNFNEYGLCFDYVAPNTFTDQKEGYFRYQLSWGGPQDEFRFYTNPDFSVCKIEYWFLDWFDGAKRELQGQDFELLKEIFHDLKDCGVVELKYKESTE
jgi:hypothetical protein